MSLNAKIIVIPVVIIVMQLLIIMIVIIIMIIIIIIIYKNLNLLLIRKLTTKSDLFTIKFCLKKKLSSTSTIYNSFQLKKPT